MDELTYFTALTFLHAKPSQRRMAIAVIRDTGDFHHLYASMIVGHDLEEIFERIRTAGVRLGDDVQFIAFGDPRYPPLLKEIADPPLALFLRGHIPRTWPRMIGVVGSRNCSEEGIILARDISRTLAAYLTVVSGLALGIDGAAHRGALESRSPLSTIAVVAGGVDQIYPRSHTKLGIEILEAGGTIISEYPMGTAHYPSQFLERNRIIAGLCSSVIVVQAAQRSGALVTARLANEYGRDLYALPWSLSVVKGEGCNNLIEQGACIVSSLESLRTVLDLPHTAAVNCNHSLSHEEEQIVAFLKEYGQTHREELHRRFGADTAIHLLNLELCGCIERIEGNFLTLRYC